jgi:hypothetical protein
MISETLVISQERVGYIIHEILDMIKLTAKWVPKRLNAINVRRVIECLLHKPFWTNFSGILCDFFKHLVTMDETHIHQWHMIQRPKNNPRIWDTEALRIWRSSRQSSH